MELFKLFGTIAINNQEANKALDETSGKAKNVAQDVSDAAESGEKSSGKFGAAMSKMGTAAVKFAKVVGTGMIAAGTAIGALVTKSIQAYADYEQLVGGVETLFKNSAAKVQEYAENAYKTAGMSANEYMETVTSFSASLLQSLGGDTAAAAEKANLAITDMSDNANKMGTSMEAIQNAYQGFAKANYTMLDNLKLGYGGTQEEMQRLLKDAEAISGIKYDISSYADVVDAIHVIQTEMGITGTTAKEASSTISGSIASMKASWKNLMTAMSNDKADFGSYVNNFVDSVSIVADNLMPRISIALNGAVQLIEKLAPVIIGKIPELFNTLLPSIISAATGLINALVAAFPGIASSIAAVLPDLINGFQSVFNGLITALPSVIQSLLDAIPTLITPLASALTSGFVTLCTMIPQIIQPLLEAIPGIVELLVDTLLDTLPAILTGITMMISELINMLPQVLPTIIAAVIQIINLVIEQLPVILPQLVNAIIMIINLLTQQLPVIIPMLIQALVQIITMLTQQLPVIIPMVIQAVIDIVNAVIVNLPTIVQSLVAALPAILQAVWNAIVMVFENLPAWFGQIFGFIKDVAVGVWNVIKAAIQPILDGIRNIIKSVWDSIKNAISNVINAIKNVVTSVWNGIKTAISNVMGGIKTTISNIWNGIKTTVSNVVNGVKTTVSNVFNSIKATATNVWNGIKSAIETPINKAKEIVGKAIEAIKGFFNFEFKWPDLKMPRFAISPSGWKIGDLLKGEIPKLSIDWYAKAMDKPMIMDKPTIFGYNPATGSLMGGGESGSEVVSGTGTLMNMIRSAVAAQSGGTEYYLQKLVEILADYFPQIMERMNDPIPAVVDPEAAAIALARPMNKQLGIITARKDRGR